MEQPKKQLTWWQLSLLGVGCIVGTGFFLGSSLAILKTGASFTLAILIAAVTTYIVYATLAKMTAQHPERGSFRSYAKQAFGRLAGFSTGWVYCSAELLIMGSQLTALSLFTKLWFPAAPLWLFAFLYGAIGWLIVFAGVRSFEKMEHGFAIIKITALILFIGLSCAGLLGWLPEVSTQATTDAESFFLQGGLGFWSALIYAFYAFGGIEIMGIMANDLKQPKEAAKAGKLMLAMLSVLYVGSLGLVLYMRPASVYSEDESPFVTALALFDLPFIPSLFNAALIAAGFSTMLASLFAITTLVQTFAKEGDAPAWFSKATKRGIPLRSLCLTAAGLCCTVGAALILPERIYVYVTTAAGLMLLFTWVMILASGKALLQHVSQWPIRLAFVLILVAISGTLSHTEGRVGFLISLAFLVCIGFFAFLRQTSRE
ncbi:amino acid permease [Aureibacillus halotolerans]|uniref:Amino acid/polyamine/organocation transporter (APC superfamily) n=1 Tax=Aureibacillus halotolerans TaxID=1508390 RepID=A0A4R6U815_9BACI|nr:amino acid permease [Aureibacillus halotolerans]TDQ40909.1 amino acid/polyamine/organocation transporter (APC superfamily) [Aureibacillus halotolerans]